MTTATATDDCNVVITHDYDLVGDPIPSMSCDGSSGLLVTFTATDDCGNMDDCSALIILTDTVVPTITCPEDLVLECDGDYASEINAWLTTATTSDACGATITHDYTNGSMPSLDCSSSGGLIVTFTSTDACGNMTNCTAQIILDDSTPPVITCPVDLVLDCDGDYASEINSWLGTVTASCLLYTSPSPRDVEESRMPSSA